MLQCHFRDGVVWTLHGSRRSVQRFSHSKLRTQEGIILATRRDSYNMLYTSISLSLIGLVMFSKKIWLKKAFLLLEIIYWLIKLFLIKSGYAIGVAAVPDSSILFYDLIALFFRILAIKIFFDQRQINLSHLAILVIVIIGLKVFYSPFPVLF